MQPNQILLRGNVRLGGMETVRWTPTTISNWKQIMLYVLFSNPFRNRLLLQPQKLKHVGVLEQVLRLCDMLALPGQADPHVHCPIVVYGQSGSSTSTRVP